MAQRITRRTTLQTGAAAAAVALTPAPARAQTVRVALRLMATSDLHVNVYPYDYYRDKPDDTVGLARTASLIKAARAQAKNSILFDNGDIIQGSPLGDFIAYEKGLKDGGAHPVIAAMNELGYAACTLGNHEFNYGLAFMDDALGGANFPVTCCNLMTPEGKPRAAPWLVTEQNVTDAGGAAHKLKIGVIGFLPPQIMQWDRGNLEGKVTTLDIVRAAEKYLPELRAQGVDLVVALCHSGISRGPRAVGEENAALSLAKVPGIDAIFTGHQHLVFPGKDFAGIEGVDALRGTLNGIPAVQPGFWGSHLGLIDLELETDGGRWKVADFKVEARPIYERAADRKIVPKVESDALVIAAAKAGHEGTRAYVRAPVGETNAPINSYFALVADDASVQLVSIAQIWYVSQLAAAIPALKNLPVLSAAAPFKSGGRGGPDYFTDVKAGPIAIKDVADIYLYPNTVRAVKINGSLVREWLERSAGIFNLIDRARTDEQPLVNPNFPAFNFDIIDGVTYEIDVTAPARYDNDGKLVGPESHRIINLKFNGAAVDPAQEFIVATNNYRADGGGNFPGCDGKTIVINAPDTNRDVIVRYIVVQKVINPAADNNWRFAPWPAGCVVTFVTSPAAAKLIPAGLRVEAMGDAEGGFSKYRLLG